MKNKKEVKDIEVIENESIDVFGTKEVSVSEFMGSTDKNLILLSSPKLAKDNLIALKKKHGKRAEELISIEKLSPAELKELNVIRGELREPRYLVQKIQTNNTSVFEAYKKTDKANLSELIEINKSLEDKVDDKIKLEDERKKKEKEDEKNAEALRVKTIQDKIEEFETKSYEIIQGMTYDGIISKSDQLGRMDDGEFDYAEYDIMFDQVKDRVTSALESKIASLTANENQRLENIRLEAENAEAKRLSDLQASRLTEIMPYVAFGAPIDLTKLSEMTDDEYQGNLSSKKGLFEADSKLKADAETERLEKEEEEKEAVYEIRKKRLEEAGMIYSDEHNSFWTKLNPEFIILAHDIYHEGTLEFENTLVEVKGVIEREQRKIDLLAEREKALSDIGMQVLDFGINFKVGDNNYFTVEKKQIEQSNSEQFSAILTQAKESFVEHRKSFVTALGYVHNPITKNFELEKFDSYSDDFLDFTPDFFKEKVVEIELHVKQRNDELSKADAEKLKAENKARVKKYAGDKKTLTALVNSVRFHHNAFSLENNESEETMNTFIIALEDFKKLWIDNVQKF